MLSIVLVSYQGAGTIKPHIFSGVSLSMERNSVMPLIRCVLPREEAYEPQAAAILDTLKAV